MCRHTGRYPKDFCFNEQLLLVVADALHSCRFGTFLCNSDRERAQQGVVSGSGVQ
jgi:myotubularin-related protein 1/2